MSWRCGRKEGRTHIERERDRERKKNIVSRTTAIRSSGQVRVFTRVKNTDRGLLSGYGQTYKSFISIAGQTGRLRRSVSLVRDRVLSRLIRFTKTS